MASSSSASPSSVRNLYTPPQEEWLFVPGPSNPSSSSSSPSSNAHPSSSSSSSAPLNISVSPSPNTSSFTPINSDLDLDLDIDPDTIPLTTLLSPYTLLTIFASEYLTTALGMPFEVGKTLLQVEWKPRRGLGGEGVGEWEEGEGEEVDLDVEGTTTAGREETIRNPEEAEAYFQDVINGSTGHGGSASNRTYAEEFSYGEERGEEGEEGGEKRDEDGYLADLPPTYLLKTDVSPSGSTGVWGMMRRIRRTPSEGLPGLWKAQILTTFHSLLSNNIQPIVHTFLALSLPPPTLTAQLELNADLDLPLSSYPNPAVPLGLHVASHLITHVFLSPLELIRTRLIVQPASDKGSKSSIGLFKDCVKEEGGFFNSLYTNPQLIIPSVLEHTLRPIFTLSIPLLIERQLHITPDISPITYSMLDLSLGLGSLLIILPIETIRKRLQLQDRTPPIEAWQKGKKIGLGSATGRKSIVRLRPEGYYGVVEGIWRIITEETSVQRKKKKRPTASRRASREDGVQVVEGSLEAEERRPFFDGVKQLYRGFGMAAGAHLTVFALGLVSAGLGGRSLEHGWKEI